jgi:hypothetical protein
LLQRPLFPSTSWIPFSALSFPPPCSCTGEKLIDRKKEREKEEGMSVWEKYQVIAVGRAREKEGKSQSESERKSEQARAIDR